MLKVAVLGLGKFGSTVAAELSRLGAEVLAVDRNRRRIEEISPLVAEAESFDATEPNLLASRGIGKMDVAIVAIGANFEASVLIAMHCKDLGVPVVAAKALNDEQETVLLKVGADQIIKPEEDMGKRLAEHLVHHSVVSFMDLPEGFSVRRIKVPKEWVDKSLAELGLLAVMGVNLIQVIRPQGENEPPKRLPLPNGEMVLQEGDEVDIIAADKTLNKFEG